MLAVAAVALKEVLWRQLLVVAVAEAVRQEKLGLGAILAGTPEQQIQVAAVAGAQATEQPPVALAAPVS